MTDRLKGMMVGLALLALPFIIEPGVSDATRIPKLKAAVLFAGLGAAYFVARNVRLSLGISVGGISALAVLHGMGSFHIYELIFIMSAVCIAAFCTNLSERSLNLVMDAIIFGGLLTTVYGYMQASGIDPVFFLKAWAPESKPTAFLGQHTLFGSFLVAPIIAAMFRHRYVCAMIMAPAVFLTDSSFAVVSLAAGLLLWTYYSQGWLTATTLAGVLAGGLLLLFTVFGKRHYFDDTGRFNAWNAAIESGMEKPVMGWGPGMFKAYYPSIQPKEHKKMHGTYKQAHNDYVQLFYEYGLVGVICATIMVCDFFKELWRKRNITVVAGMGAILIAFLVNALGSFPFHLMPHGLIALCAWTAVVTHKPRPLEGI